MIGNSNKKVFRRLKDIPSQNENHKHKFSKGKNVGDRNMCWLDEKKPPKTYSCKDKNCDTKAYYCPKCKGHLEGEPVKKKYDEIGLMVGTSGYDYYCGKCTTRLGRTELVYS